MKRCMLGLLALLSKMKHCIDAFLSNQSSAKLIVLRQIIPLRMKSNARRRSSWFADSDTAADVQLMLLRRTLGELDFYRSQWLTPLFAVCVWTLRQRWPPVSLIIQRYTGLVNVVKRLHGIASFSPYKHRLIDLWAKAYGFCLLKQLKFRSKGLCELRRQHYVSAICMAYNWTSDQVYPNHSIFICFTSN